MKLFLASLVIVILIGVLFNTIIRFSLHIKDSLSKVQNAKYSNKNKLFWDRYLNVKLEEDIYLDNPTKWKIWLYILSFSLLALNKNFSFSITIQIIIGIICILAVGDFIHSVNKFVNNDLFSKIMFTSMNLLILMMYILTFNIVFLELNFNVNILIIITIILIFYTFVFIKGIVDTFESYFVQFISFILILLFFNFITIGFNFGLFYLNNNEFFGYYESEEAEKIYQSFSEENQPLNWGYVLLVIYEGIGPFFNFPDRIPGENGFISFIPLIEHFIGNIFNLLIVGFFVSYSVTNLFERRNKLAKLKK